MTPPQAFPFQQVFNFRDLGGHVTGDGRHVRSGVLYRSAAPTDATKADSELLEGQLGVRTLIDLRHAPERERFPMTRTWPGREVHLPLFRPDDTLRQFPTLGEGYADALKRPHVGRRLVQVLSLFAQEAEVPAVFFCSAGKDRTGLVAAAILSSLGVPDEAVADDYARSADSLDSMFAFWARRPNSAIEETLQTFPHVMGAPRGAMTQMLEMVREDFGSMRGYLTAQGADPSLFEGLESRLLD